MKTIAMAFAALLQAQFMCYGQCDDKLTPSDNQSITYKERRNRCEGTYSAKVGARSMEIVGFTVGAFRYKLERTEVIKITNTIGSDVFIRASPLLLDTYYRMDATLPDNQTLEWQVGEILLRLRIQSKYLAVHGWLGSERDMTYVPIKPVSSNYNESDKNLYLVVRTKTSVTKAKFRYAPSGQALGNYEEIDRHSGTRQSIAVILPENLKGEYVIEIAASLESSDDWEVNQYKLLVK
jgi:hypothetical protein